MDTGKPRDTGTFEQTGLPPRYLSKFEATADMHTGCCGRVRVVIINRINVLPGPVQWD